MKSIPILLAALAFVFGQSTTRLTLGTSADDVLRALEAKRSRAQVAGDVRTLDELLAPEFMEMNAAGNIRTKAQNLQGHGDHQTRWQKFDLTQLQVEVHGDTAVVRGHLVRKGASGGRDLSGESDYTRYFVRRDGKWQAVFQYGVAAR